MRAGSGASPGPRAPATARGRTSRAPASVCRRRAASEFSGDVHRLVFPGGVAAVGAAGADEQALAGHRLIALEPPVEPGEVDLREVASARAKQIAAVPEILAE